MKIWLVTIGEPIPSDSTNPRLLRTGILANMLSRHGHEVIWWNTKFNHTKKSYRERPSKLKISENLEIILLESPGYKKNISIKRLYDHFILSRNFKKKIKNEKRPDIIVASFPTPDLCEVVVDFGNTNNIPTIIDIRDLWPEAFELFFPIKNSLISKIILYPLKKKSERICKKATGLLGVSSPFLNWGLIKANREKTKMDNVFYFGYPKKETDEIDWTILSKIQYKERTFSLCYIGNLGHYLDFEALCLVMNALQKEKTVFQLIICGTGVVEKRIESLFKDFKNVYLTGFINANQLAAVMEYADVGIAPYTDSINFRMAFPNKIIEYLSGGLPVMTSIEGFMGNFLKEHNVGFSYRNDKTETLVNILKDLNENRDKLTQMKKNALQLYKVQFRAEKIYHDYMKHLEFVIENYKDRFKNVKYAE